MPLDPAALQSALESLFATPPSTAAECARAWADAVGSYAGGLVPTSTALPAATATLTAALQSAFESPSAGSSVDAAFTAFAVTVAAGMLPAFTGVPPGSPLGVVAQLSDPQQTHELAAALFTALIDSWLKTGTASLVAPPNTVVTWM